MEKEIDWIDLYIKDFGASQIDDKTELSKKQKKMRTFYAEFLLPLYIPVQDNKEFKFSVEPDKLTCHIMLEDLRKYHKLVGIRDLLYKVSENKPSLTPDKIEKLLQVMQTKKEEQEEKTR